MGQILKIKVGLDCGCLSKLSRTVQDKLMPSWRKVKSSDRRANKGEALCTSVLVWVLLQTYRATD